MKNFIKPVVNAGKFSYRNILKFQKACGSKWQCVSALEQKLLKINRGQNLGPQIRDIIRDTVFGETLSEIERGT